MSNLISTSYWFSQITGHYNNLLSDLFLFEVDLLQKGKGFLVFTCRFNKFNLIVFCLGGKAAKAELQNVILISLFNILLDTNILED